MRKFSLSIVATDGRCVHNPGYELVKSKTIYNTKATIAQFLATIVQSLMLVNVGMELAMPTVLIGSLYKNPNAEFFLSDSESSWYGSLLYLCQPFGSCLCGYVQKRYGKKICMVLACVPSIVGWIMLWNTRSALMLYLSTLTMGLGLGFTDGPAYTYVGEICEPRLRGIMSCVINMACLIGVMFSFGLGSLCHWQTVVLLCTVCPVTCLLLVALIPESPIWLLAQGQNQKAMDAICWLRGWVDPSVVANEYQELLIYYKTSIEQMKATRSSTGWFSSVAFLKNPSVYRPLQLITLYYVVTLISCLTPCRPYIVEVMYESGVKNTHSIALILFGFMQLFGSIGLTLTIRKVGKRVLTISSLSVNIVALFVFGAYIACIQNDLMYSRIYIPLALYSIIMFSSAMGMLTIPWTLISEIYPNEAKGFASSLTTAILYILTFASTKLYLSIKNELGLYNTIFMFAVFSFVGLIYLYKKLPETENKTFTEIEEFFVPKENIQLEPELPEA